MTRPKKNHLKIYARHVKKCKTHKRPTDSDYCGCPIWIRGHLNGKTIRESLNTTSDEIAARRRKEMLFQANSPDDTPGGGIRVVGGKEEITLGGAAAKFEEFKAGKMGVDAVSVNSRAIYRKAVAGFAEWAEKQGIELIRSITVEDFAEYMKSRTTWKSPRSRRSGITHLNVFFKFAKAMKWIEDTPIGKHFHIEVSPEPARAPLTPEEIARLLELIEKLEHELGRNGTRRYRTREHVNRIRAAIYLMLFSGLRISDVTFLERAAVRGNELDPICLKNRKKLGKPVLFPPCVLDALAKLPPSRVYFFIPDREDDYLDARMALRSRRRDNELRAVLGKQFVEKQIRNLEQSVTRVMRKAGIMEGSCHRLRDTFSVNHLDGKGDIFALSLMLGHSSVTITQAHYVNLVESYRRAEAPVLNYRLPSAG